MDAKNFDALVKAVAQIDAEAAEWLKKGIDGSGRLFGSHAQTLSELFFWSNSPQGFDFWMDVDAQLGKSVTLKEGQPIDYSQFCGV